MLAWFSEMFNALAAALLSVLPTSPFSDAIANLSDLPYLGWLNWFIPVGTCIKIAGAWLVAIGLFYVYSIAMRWVKMIGD